MKYELYKLYKIQSLIILFIPIIFFFATDFPVYAYIEIIYYLFPSLLMISLLYSDEHNSFTRYRYFANKGKTIEYLLDILIIILGSLLTLFLTLVINLEISGFTLLVTLSRVVLSIGITMIVYRISKNEIMTYVIIITIFFILVFITENFGPKPYNFFFALYVGGDHINYIQHLVFDFISGTILIIIFLCLNLKFNK